MRYFVRRLLQHRAFRQAPLRTLWRALCLAINLAFQRETTFSLQFGRHPFIFPFRPGERHAGGRGIFLYRERIEPLYQFGDQFLSDGAVCIDGGANQGIYTLAFATAVGDRGHVIAVEPMEGPIAVLQEGARINDLTNITVLQKVLYERTDELRLDHTQGIGGASILRDHGGRSTIPVEATTIDHIVDDLSLTRLDLVKLDIEGAELAALQGAEYALRTFQPILSVEAHPDEFVAMKAFLHPFGYEPALFDVSGSLERIEKIEAKEPNVLFVPAHFSDL